MVQNRVSFGERLAEIREHSGLRQYHLAEELNVMQQTISSWERNIHNPNLDFLIQMSDLFGCTVGQLAGVESVNVDELPVLFTE